MSPRRLTRRTVMIVLAAALLAGCDSGTRPGSPAAGSTEIAMDISTLRLPLDSYRLQRMQVHTIDRAINILTQRCLREFGFNIHPPTVIPPAVGDNENRYGLVHEAKARTLGYHPAPGHLRTEPAGKGMSGAAEAVLRGTVHVVAGQRVPAGGCLGHSQRALVGKVGRIEDSSLVIRLEAAASRHAEEDEHVREAFRAWSVCMARAGHPYPDPWAANDDKAWLTPVPTRREISVAVADVRCKREVNLINIWAAAETAYQRQLIDRHRTELDTIKRSINKAHDAATAVLAR